MLRALLDFAETGGLLSRSNKVRRDGIQVSEAITGDGAAIFRHACWMDLEGIVSVALREWQNAGMAEDAGA